MTTQLDVTRRALAQIGTRSSITSMTDGSPEATYANLLYAPLRDYLLRDGDYDFAINEFTAEEVVYAPDWPWRWAWQMPVGMIRVRNLIVPDPDINDPQPVPFNIVYNTDYGQLIRTKREIALVVGTVAPPEDFWDAMFMESFTRLLASALAFALENRIEASEGKLREAMAFAQQANLRTG